MYVPLIHAFIQFIGARNRLGVLNYSTNLATAFQKDDIDKVAISRVAEVEV